MSTKRTHYVQQLLTHFDADPGRPALVSKDTLFTAGELADVTRRAAAVMSRHGIGHGGVVRILTEPNAAETLILQWAANLLGATAAHVRWLHPDWPDDELRLELGRAVGAGMLAVDAGNEARTRGLLADMPDQSIVAVLRIGADAEAGVGTSAGAADPDAVDLTDAPGDAVSPCPDITDDDLAIITQTRLSSGLRAGVCWTFGTKNDMVASAPWLPAVPATPDASTPGRRDAPRALITAPLIHSDGFDAEDTLICGGLVALHNGFDATHVLRTIAEHRITRLVLGAPQMYALAEHPDRADTDLSSLTELFYLGSRAAPQRLREAREVFGPALIQVYGTTETLVLAMRAADEQDHDSGREQHSEHGEHGEYDQQGAPDTGTPVGRPLNPAALSIRHPDTGEALPVGTAGEICAQPRWPSAGYWHEPGPTAELVRDGWTRTGDLGHLDADGCLHVSGRIADMLRINGALVHPEDLERILNQAPGVAQAAVCSAEDPDRVERVYATVVPQPGATIDLEQLRRRIAETLSDDHVPALIEIRQAMPAIGLGKPDRVKLRADARMALARRVSRV